MIYLTFEEYSNMGGICDETAFNRNINRACGIIDNATHKRIEKMKKVPQNAKFLCRELIDYMSKHLTFDAPIQSRSQSAGGVSESESYVVKSKDELQIDIDDMIMDYLMSEVDNNGTPLLYRGAMR